MNDRGSMQSTQQRPLYRGGLHPAVRPPRTGRRGCAPTHPHPPASASAAAARCACTAPAIISAVNSECVLSTPMHDHTMQRLCCEGVAHTAGSPDSRAHTRSHSRATSRSCACAQEACPRELGDPTEAVVEDRCTLFKRVVPEPAMRNRYTPSASVRHCTLTVDGRAALWWLCYVQAARNQHKELRARGRGVSAHGVGRRPALHVAGCLLRS